MKNNRLYFAYGSNINLDQMRLRCPDAHPVEAVELSGYELLFRGFSMTGGFATIAPKEGAAVPGLLWSITPSSEKALDIYEGFPRLYEKQEVTVRDRQGREFSAMVYVMTEEQILQPSIPSSRYFQGILDGYRQTDLPESVLSDALEHVCQEVYRPAEEKAGRLYFAYGSNLNHDQMGARCPDAYPVENAVLHNHTLAFRKRGDGKGVATVIPSLTFQEL